MRIAKVVSLSLSATLIAGMVGLTGCGTRTDNTNLRTQNVRNKNYRNYDVNSLRPGDRNFTRSLGNGQSERINSLKYSPALSNKVAQLREVQSAHVVVTDRDAYVAVTLHGQGHQGTRASGMHPGTNYGTTTRYGNQGTTNYGMTSTGTTGLGRTPGAFPNGTAGFGTGTGYGYGTRTGTGLGNGTLGYGTGTGTGLGTGYGTGTGTGTGTGMGAGTGLGTGYGTGYGTNDGLGGGLMGRSGVAGSLFDTTTRGNRGMTGLSRGTDGMLGMKGTRHRTNVDGVGTAPVRGLGTGTGAVVDNVPQSVKDHISSIVKKTAPHIRNVHVSGDPEFMTHVSNYATQHRTGATLQGRVRDFEHLVNRIFPGRAGTMTGPSGYRNTGGGVGTTGTGTGMSGTTGTGTGSGAGFSGGVTR
ncbi:hypothetical protein YSY43_01840 [Paenibacillus sp. YSY-4.3]